MLIFDPHSAGEQEYRLKARLLGGCMQTDISLPAAQSKPDRETLAGKKRPSINKKGGAVVYTLMNNCWPQGLVINAAFLSA